MDAYINRDFYRKQINAKDLVFYRVSFKETDLFVGSKQNLSEPILSAVKLFRQMLDEHIENNPKFHSSLIPIGYNVDENTMIKRMHSAAKMAGVGPMATVAGAFCQTAYEAVCGMTPELIVENGGDLLVCSEKPRTIALYAGASPLNMKLGLSIKKTRLPLGICSSAGTVGHSLSFGKADLALCISNDVLLADACATRLGNAVKSQADLKPAVQDIAAVDGILGAVAVIGTKIAAVGDIKLVPIDKTL